MKRRGGQDGPDSEETPEDEDRARRERVRRERLRAQRRLADKAGGASEDAPAEEPKATAKADADAKPAAAKSKDESRPKPAAKKSASRSKPAGERAEEAKGKGKPVAKGKRKPEVEGKPTGDKRPGGKGGGSTPKRKGAEGRRPQAKGKAGAGRSRAARGAGAATALKQGVAATRRRTRGVPSRIGGAVLAALVAFFAVFFGVIGFAVNALLGIVATLRGPTLKLISAVRSAIAFASAQVTPRRTLAAVVAGAAVLLALSQFADYRSISVGTDAYAEVETVAPAPERERDETGSAHSYLMVPLAVVAIGLLVAALSGGGRWRLCRGIAIIGVVAIGVSLLVDRPAGLDPGDLEQAYDGVRANLLGGFYAQLFSGILLTASALLLSRDLRPAAAPAENRSRPGAGKRVRRSAKPEGARA